MPALLYLGLRVRRDHDAAGVAVRQFLAGLHRGVMRHAGHAGAASGAGHFRITISSEKFNGLKPIQRHRLVYDAVGDLMQTDIHALAINALAASE